MRRSAFAFVCFSMALSGAAGAPPHAFSAGSAPAVGFSTYLRGYQSSVGRSVAVDGQGAIIVAGTRDDGDLHSGSFVLKLASSGQAILWRDEFDATVNAVATDAQGNVYLAGSIGSGYWPAVNALQPSPLAATSAVVAKLDPSGKILYSTYLGGLGTDSAEGIAADSRGEAVVTGTSHGPFPVFAGLSRATGNPAQGVAFITKLNPAGNHVVYSTTVGGRFAAAGFAVALNGSGSSAYVAVRTSAGDPGFPSTRLTRGFSPGKAGTAVLKLFQGKRTIQLVYSIRMSDSCATCGGIALDPGGDVYAALGQTLVKVNPGGTALDWRRHPMLPGNIAGDGQSVGVDSRGDATVVGTIADKRLVTLPPLAGVGDTPDGGYVGRFDRIGRPLFRTFLPHARAYGVSVGGRGNAVITGEATGSGFPTLHDISPEIPLPICDLPSHAGSVTGLQCPTAFVTKILG
jgi:Beta-propeller repeat